MANENQDPTEIITGPAAAWYGAVGTPQTALEAAVVAPFVTIGNSGWRSQDEEGLTITNSVEYASFPGQSTVDRKRTRTSEKWTIKVKIADLTLEAWLLSLNQNGISTVPAGSGTAGYKEINLFMGSGVKYICLLVRALSPYSTNAAAFTQYYFPKVSNVKGTEIKHSKGEFAGIELEFESLEGPNASATDGDIGKIRAWNANPL